MVEEAQVASQLEEEAHIVVVGGGGGEQAKPQDGLEVGLPSKKTRVKWM